jgi:tRNA(Ile)-lysidine synthetase-like protein
MFDIVLWLMGDRVVVVPLDRLELDEQFVDFDKPLNVGFVCHGPIIPQLAYNSKMRIDLKPGTYVVAVSGGVDSMVLLHLLRHLPEVRVVVAHFDHGIREDSPEDLRLVAATARSYGLPFVSARGALGPRAGEAQARDARYAFLRRVQAAQGAAAIITAHHQDDVIETAIINSVRGTGSHGLSALRTREAIVRPLLAFPKQTLLEYAKAKKLLWREDSTNQDLRYKRNYVRRVVLPPRSARNF